MGENELSSKVVDIHIFSFYSYSTLRPKFLVVWLCYGFLHMSMSCMSIYVMSALCDNILHALDNVMIRLVIDLCTSYVNVHLVNCVIDL